MRRLTAVLVLALLLSASAMASSCSPMFESHYLWCADGSCRVEFIVRDTPSFGTCARYKQTFDGASQRGRWMESLGRLLGEPDGSGAFRIDLWLWGGHPAGSVLEATLVDIFPKVDFAQGFDGLDGEVVAAARELAARNAPWRSVDVDRRFELAGLRASIADEGKRQYRRALWRFTALELLPGLALALLLGYSQWRFYGRIWNRSRPLTWRDGWVTLPLPIAVFAAALGSTWLRGQQLTFATVLIAPLALICLALQLIALLVTALARWAVVRQGRGRRTLG